MQRSLKLLVALIVVQVLTLFESPRFSFAVDYQLVRIASGLNQPTYVTQAPGDPANMLYFTERTSNTIQGFGAVNQMGKVWTYDVTTKTKSLVLDLSALFPGRTVTNDTGLQTIAFSPDFNTVGSPTYKKMYVSYAERGSVAINHVEEFNIEANGTATFSRNILQYTNGTQNNHTVNWIGFDPTATGRARGYLYISTGDGAFGNAYNGGAVSNGRPSQNPASIRGKMVRVDVSGGDDYDGTKTINGTLLPNDGERNFRIPPTNPLVTYNAANPGSQISGRYETYLTGLRNGYRASFDRANGDLYWGDVGEVNVEELNVLKAGTNNLGPPADFGWPIREGTLGSGISGAPSPSTTTNPFTTAPLIDPIQQFNHVPGSGGAAIIGGYMYRGPIAELQGKFFYADFVPTDNTFSKPQLYMLDFDRNTATSAYNGNNGTVTNISALWNSLVVDPSDPAYPGNAAGTSGLLDHIVSFGEDSAGNLYLVDMGSRSTGQSIFEGEYPAAGLGEIYMLVAVPEPSGVALAAVSCALLIWVRVRRTHGRG